MYAGNFAIHPDIQDMKLLPNGETWVSTDGGFSYTTDNFTSINNYFARINGIVDSDMWGFDQVYMYLMRIILNSHLLSHQLIIMEICMLVVQLKMGLARILYLF